MLWILMVLFSVKPSHHIWSSQSNSVWWMFVLICKSGPAPPMFQACQWLPVTLWGKVRLLYNTLVALQDLAPIVPYSFSLTSFLLFSSSPLLSLCVSYSWLSYCSFNRLACFYLRAFAHATPFIDLIYPGLSSGVPSHLCPRVIFLSETFDCSLRPLPCIIFLLSAHYHLT